jgi:uncharacterized protein
MACEYCFYLGKNSLFPGTIHRMSDAILEETLRQFMEQSPAEVSLSWQGGEPTLMGLDFFRKAMELLQHYGQGQVAGNGLQTGGILIDSDWARFLKEFHFLVGLSLDGTQHVHDRYRKDKGGNGTWNRVMAGLNHLRKENVSVNAIATLNRYSAENIEETYSFFRDEGLAHMQFIPIVQTDVSGITDFSVSGEAFGHALITLFDLWRDDFHLGSPTTFIRFFDAVYHYYAGVLPAQCTLLDQCGTYLVIEHDGSVYPCDFFVEDTLCLGNVMTHRLDEMLNSPQQNAFAMKKGYVPAECRTCPWLALCHGGCPAERVGRINQSNRLCKGYKMFFEYSDSWFRKKAISSKI